MEIGRAYSICEEITWREARNFAYGIRLMPGPKRQAMAALYAMARRIDDIGDGAGSPEERLSELNRVHGVIETLEDGHVGDEADPVLVALADAARRYPIPLGVLHEIVEGCEMDAIATRYRTMDDTIRYCRLVAGSVGRLSLGVFGVRPDPRHPGREAEAPRLADDLGVALQLTNMLRDILEDHQMGRIYLPEEDRRRLGVIPGEWAPAEHTAALVESVAAEAARWFSRGLPLLSHLDWRSRACTAAMAGIYRRLLRRIQADPTIPLMGRVSLPTWEKALVAVRSVSGLSP